MAVSFLGNGTVSTVYREATTAITGDPFLTLFILVVVFMFFGIAAQLSFEVILNVVMPMMLVFFAYHGQLQLVTTISVIILGYITAKYAFG